MIFNERLKEIRTAKKLSQKEIADKIGITEQAYQKYEYGKNQPLIDKATEIAKALDTSLDYLTGLSDNKTIGGSCESIENKNTVDIPDKETDPRYKQIPRYTTKADGMTELLHRMNAVKQAIEDTGLPADEVWKIADPYRD